MGLDKKYNRVKHTYWKMIFPFINPEGISPVKELFCMYLKHINFTNYGKMHTYQGKVADKKIKARFCSYMKCLS